MNEIDDKMLLHLEEILSVVESYQNDIDAEFEKLQIALTGVIRLLSGDASSTLQGLGGNPEQLKAYIVRLTSSLRDRAGTQWADVRKRLQETLSRINHE